MLAFHPPMEVHAEHIDAAEVCSFNIEFTAAWACGVANRSLPFERPFDCDAGPAVGLAVRLLDEFAHFDASSPLIVEGLTLELLGVCDRQVRDQQDSGRRLPPRWLRSMGELFGNAAARLVEPV